MNPDRVEFLADLRSSGQLWTYGETDTPDRVAFFADYLWHTDHVLHNTALVEIGRAPYELVRPIGDRYPTSLILQEFSDLNRFAYRPSAIRLLGLQTDRQARSVTRSRYVEALKPGDLNSFDWALAGIEADQESAISAIGAALQNPQLTDVDKISLIRALSEAGSAQAKFRTQITRIFSNVLQKEPQLALQIAIATRNWGQTALYPQFEDLIVSEKTDVQTQFYLNLVLQSKNESD